MKIIVITDVHANLPALRTTLSAAKSEGYDLLVHTGDAIAIGPYPAETLDLLLSLPNARFIKGNHDQWFADGLPNPIPEWMSQGEVEHQHWTHSQIDSKLRSILADWPMIIREKFEGVEVAFMHYKFDETTMDFESVLRDPTGKQLDELFHPFPVPVLFYGHSHVFWDKQGQARYINPGSLGCFLQAVARYAVLEIKNGTYQIEHRAVKYDDRDIGKTFEQRNVPDREFICRTFFGGRFERLKTRE